MRTEMKTLTEAINGLTWGGGEYAEYGGEMKSGPGAAEKSAETGRAEDRATAKNQTGMSDADLSDVEGPTTQDTPMYKRMLSLSTEDTARTYDQARTVRAKRANSAGFGYAQPIAQSDKNAVDMNQARDIGNLPREVAGDVEPFRMQAANIHAGEASSYLGSGNTQLSTWASAEEARKKRQASMWGKLAGAGLMAAAPFTGGASLALAGAGEGLMKSS